ncbi:hypothetical protein LTR85_002512 [Meristemomyces frigidus]|nr:hypothetical protein LTR85_002512 [Meristemomyces frigidus]
MREGRISNDQLRRLHAGAVESRDKDELWIEHERTLREFREAVEKDSFPANSDWFREWDDDFTGLPLYTLLKYKDVAVFDGDPAKCSARFQTHGRFAHVYNGIHRGIYIFGKRGILALVPGNGRTEAELVAMSREEAEHLGILLNEGESLPVGTPDNLTIIWTRDYDYGLSGKFTIVHLNQRSEIKKSAGFEPITCVITVEGQDALCAKLDGYEAEVSALRAEARKRNADRLQPSTFAVSPTIPAQTTASAATRSTTIAGPSPDSSMAKHERGAYTKLAFTIHKTHFEDQNKVALPVKHDHDTECTPGSISRPEHESSRLPTDVRAPTFDDSTPESQTSADTVEVTRSSDSTSANVLPAVDSDEEGLNMIDDFVDGQ